MKFFSCTSANTKFLALLVCTGAVSIEAAETDQPLAVHARTAAPAAGAAQVVEPPAPPLSTFVIPRKVSEGRDPFFPNSSRVYGTEGVVTNRAATIIADLVLKGISGTPELPLAIINSTTFTAGEVNEVIIKNGRLRIQCLEINMSVGTVLVQIGAERRELKLASSK